MARFMAVHTLPMTEEQARGMIQNPPAFAPGVMQADPAAAEKAHP